VRRPSAKEASYKKKAKKRIVGSACESFRFHNRFPDQSKKQVDEANDEGKIDVYASRIFLQSFTISLSNFCGR
jgi:hypothetical protein